MPRMNTSNTTTEYGRALQSLAHGEIIDGYVIYWDDNTRCYHVGDEDDLESLQKCLDDGVDDAYSLWCGDMAHTGYDTYADAMTVVKTEVERAASRAAGSQWEKKCAVLRSALELCYAELQWIECLPGSSVAHARTRAYAALQDGVEE